MAVQDSDGDTNHTQILIVDRTNSDLSKQSHPNPCGVFFITISYFEI